jgi:hypothetical protein
MERLLRSPVFVLGGWALAILLGVVAIVLGTRAGNPSGTVRRSDAAKEGSAPLDESPSEKHDFFNVVVHTLDPDRLVGVFPYIRDLPSGAHWTAGDRNAYGCAYMFLLDARNQVVGRVTFAALEQSGSYVRVNDRYMAESSDPGWEFSRDYGGSLYTVQPTRENLNGCARAAESYGPPVPGPIPVIKFITTRGDVLETRDYAKVYESTTRGHNFRIVERTPDSVTVVAYEDRVPVMAVYYDRLSSQITLEANVS